ncbi:tryptophan synthase subunit alpha [Moraxella caviae]|uniref:Tryptophan synthase alpha chain n=1 Tax=Moraxella caviae TaxID=34060 RepID=A0A1S9ZWA5_9GAMM|nr:tryptophan synthase subunit alpha [Moraxella caviae]OOR87211.1 tryptophan synthase subunit alpha [Moraxella caviae]STZ09926.1 Tryptophan synthase alpha chain [Moraxella caviae]
MQSRIEKTLANLKSQNKKALIPYIMAGDPTPSVTVPLLHKLVAHGADVIELGLPFSDPMADGQTIALADERALAGGTSTRQAIEMIKEFRKTNTTTPVLVMGYLNPVEMLGYDKFAALCKDAGIDGVLLVDLPPQEAGDFPKALQADDTNPINQIFLLSPTTTDERTDSVIKNCSGFIYYVSVKGVTGAASLDVDEVNAQIARIKAKTDIPVCVGFGIKDGKSAKALASVADGVIVGSELVKNFAECGTDEQKITQAVDRLLAKMDELRAAIDG